MKKLLVGLGLYVCASVPFASGMSLNFPLLHGNQIENDDHDCYAGVFNHHLFVDFGSVDADHYLEMVSIDELDAKSSIPTSTGESIVTFETLSNAESIFYQVFATSKRVIGVVKMSRDNDGKAKVLDLCQ